MTEHLIDVRPMPPRERHPTIFNTWHSLADGEAMVIVNDHDPVPLYYQFTCEHQGGFRWEYVENGPETWRVRVHKGHYPDPGFVPGKRAAAAPVVAPIEFVEPLVLDTRPIFARGGSPCQAIDDAVGSLIPGQPFVLLVPFEPAPLYAKLGREGFTHQPQRQPDGTWRIEFRRPAGASATPAHAGCGCGSI